MSSTKRTEALKMKGNTMQEGLVAKRTEAQLVKDFCDKLAMLSESVKEAAVVYVEIIDTLGEKRSLEIVRKHAPALEYGAPILEEIGRGRLVAEAWTWDRCKVNAMMQLPTSTQNSIVAGRQFEVAIPGKADHRLLTVDQMPAAAVRQVFDRGHVRDVTEQLAWIERQPSPAEVKPTPLPFEVKGGRFTAREPFTMDAKQLLRMLMEA